MTLELDGHRVLVGIGGSVAAYKACEVVTDLRRIGVDVKVAMTEAAMHFVTPTLLRALSGHPVASSIWEDEAEEGHGMSHLDLASWCEVQVVVAASADLIARLALGLAATRHGDRTRLPRTVARRAGDGIARCGSTPRHRAISATLTARGARIIGPVHGRLASGHESTGRMAEPDAIVAVVREFLVRGA